MHTIMHWKKASTNNSIEVGREVGGNYPTGKLGRKCKDGGFFLNFRQGPEIFFNIKLAQIKERPFVFQIKKTKLKQNYAKDT